MFGPGNDKPLPIVLLIENDENDVFLFRRALAAADWSGEVRVVGSTSEGRAYLLNRAPFQDKTYFRPPALIVSDYLLKSQTVLNTPKLAAMLKPYLP